MKTASTLKISGLSDLEKIRANIKKENEQTGAQQKEKILVCMGGGCLASGSQKIKDRFDQALKLANLDKSAVVVGTGCLGPCSHGPVVVMAWDKIFYQNITVDDVDEIVDQHIKNNKIIERLAFCEDVDSKPIPVLTDIGFFKRQTKIVLRNCGEIDPLSIDEYIGHEGYFFFSQGFNRDET
jgi:NADH-quinone oxidoreductase subunit F